jgi:diketogulonate reductase-like aldo/keto reductase
MSAVNLTGKIDPCFRVGDVKVPRMIYGTAWKEAKTEHSTQKAIRAGFRGIDSANQRKHYDEAAVGRGIAAAVTYGVVHRDDLFLQTKFTYRSSQDYRLPYDPAAPIETQVEQSFASSCLHLGTKVIDSYLLHGPSTGDRLGPDDWKVWRALEGIHDRGAARLIGISNVNAEQLTELCHKARIRPHVVQNRCFADAGWDRRVRDVCREHDILYQGFSLLTANLGVLRTADVQRIAKQHRRTIAQIIFRFALQVGMIALTGTTDAHHMHDDLAAFDFVLLPDEVARIETLGEPR